MCHQGEPDAVAGLFKRLEGAHLTPSIVVINAATNPVYVPLLDLECQPGRRSLTSTSPALC